MRLISVDHVKPNMVTCPEHLRLSGTHPVIQGGLGSGALLHNVGKARLSDTLLNSDRICH
ncbi:MAG: hypothetical protein ACOY4Q_09015 [Bacillota bacterium]